MSKNVVDIYIVFAYNISELLKDSLNIWCATTEGVEVWNNIGWCAPTKDVEMENDIGWRATAKGVEVWNNNGKHFASPFYIEGVQMRFKQIQFVYIDMAYLEYLHSIDDEIWFDKTDENYRFKPHLGILINNDNREYVIPLTSAKEKHKTWDDVTANWYRIYEIIDITESHVHADDIIVEIKNRAIIKTLDKENLNNYKQRILSVLDMRKMFPVCPSVYQMVEFDINSSKPLQDIQRTFLMLKEFKFLEDKKEEIEIKTSKIYNKQIERNKVLPYHCNYKRLEAALDQYMQ